MTLFNVNKKPLVGTSLQTMFLYIDQVHTYVRQLLLYYLERN